MQGYLKIWQGVLSRWKESYFILHNGILTYCDKKGGEKQGQIYLKIASIIAVIDDPLRIRIHSGTTVLNLRADHPSLKIKWMKSMNSAKQQIQIQEQSKISQGVINIRLVQILQKLTQQIWDVQSKFQFSISEFFAKIKLSQSLMNLSKKIVYNSKQIKKKIHEALQIFKRIVKSQKKNSNLSNLNFTQIQESILEKSWINREDYQKKKGNNTSLKVQTKNYNNYNNYNNDQKKKTIIPQQNNINQSHQSSFKSFLCEDISLLNTNSPVQKFYFLENNQRNINNYLRDISDKCLPKKKLIYQNDVFLQTLKHINFDTERSKLPIQSDNKQINLIGIIKGVIGSDIFSLNLPIITNEPLSYLQRLAQQMLYQDLLIKANQQYENSKRLLYVIAFASSIYSTTLKRAKLPFKPLLGQTFELKNKKYRYISEQVQSNISAFHCESQSYIIYGSLKNQTKFTGKTIEMQPKGYTYIHLKKPNQTIYFKRCKTQYRNLIFGEATIHNIGNIELIDQNDVAFLNFKDRGFWFDDSRINQVQGWVKTSGILRYQITGTWNQELWGCSQKHSKIKIWTNTTKQKEQYYSFTNFAINLNHLNIQLLQSIQTTDSRLRPDVRALQHGLYDLAESQKQRLYKKQKKRQEYYEPKWFNQDTHKLTAIDYYAYNQRYQIEKQNISLAKEIY